MSVRAGLWGIRVVSVDLRRVWVAPFARSPLVRRRRNEQEGTGIGEISMVYPEYVQLFTVNPSTIFCLSSAKMLFIFSTQDIGAMKKVKMAFDPEDLYNPGKVLPEIEKTPSA